MMLVVLLIYALISLGMFAAAVMTSNPATLSMPLAALASLLWFVVLPALFVYVFLSRDRQGYETDFVHPEDIYSDAV